MKNQDGGGLLSLLTQTREVARTAGGVNAAVNNSLIAQLKSTKVEPVVLIDRTLIHNPITESLCSLVLDQYVVMYTAVASRYLNMGVDSAKVIRTMERLATERDLLQAIANESDKDLLSVAIESDSRAKADGKLLSQINDNAPLSLGKVVSLTFTGEKGGSYEAQAYVRLQTKSCTPELIKAVFEANYVDLNPLSRIKLYGLGEITFTEIFTCAKEINAQEKARMQDKDGVIQSNFVNAAKNVGYTALTGEVPINAVSGINIVSSSTLKTIESMLGGRFDKFKVRQKFFENTACMLMVVMDHEDEMATLYYRDLKDETEVPFRWLERKGKSGSNLEPMVKDILSGSVPALR